MNRKLEMISMIKEVLEYYSSIETNISSDSAREMIADSILNRMLGEDFRSPEKFSTEKPGYRSYKIESNRTED